MIRTAIRSFTNNNIIIMMKYAIPIATVVLALASQISFDIPMTEIPLTMQSLVVLLIAMILGRFGGTLTILLYLLLGTLGLPVFAGGASGWDTITGNTGGYLIGFVLATYVLGYLADKSLDNSFWKLITLMTLGTAIIIALGVLRLYYTFGFEKALEYGFYPVLPGAIVKIIIGAGFIYLLNLMGIKYQENL